MLANSPTDVNSIRDEILWFQKREGVDDDLLASVLKISRPALCNKKNGKRNFTPEEARSLRAFFYRFRSAEEFFTQPSQEVPTDAA